MNIKRYGLWLNEDRGESYIRVKEEVDGEFAKWSDVEKLIALRAAEAAELEAWRNHSEKCKNAIKMGIMAATNAARRGAGVEQCND